MSGVMALQGPIFRRFLPVLSRRFVSTSKKANETAVVDTAKAKVKQKIEYKNWMSYGFDDKDIEADRNAMHSIAFIGVTICLVGGFFYIAYLPDYNLADWAHRQAFLEIRRREKLGLPLVDPNLIDPSLIQLPSDEELEDTEIII